MTRAEALKEAQRRWPASRLHNAYESIIRGRVSMHEVTMLYHVCCYHPDERGVGGSWEAAFADAERRQKAEDSR